MFCFFRPSANSHQCTPLTKLAQAEVYRKVGYTMDLSGSAARVVFKGAAAHLHSLVRWCERGGPPLARGLAVSSVRWNSMDAPDDADSIAYATWDQLLKEKRMISLEKKSHDEGIF